MKKKTDVVPPTAEEVPVLTDRLVEVKRELEALTAEKDLIEARLELWALSQQHEPLKDAQREGRKVSLAGTRHRATVTFTSDALIGSFKRDSAKHQELLRVLGPLTHETDVSAPVLLEKFFSPPDTFTSRFKDGQKFREAAAELLPKEVAPKFIAACRVVDKFGIPKNKTTFDVQPAAAEEVTES
jgi:hypothetical protein